MVAQAVRTAQIAGLASGEEEEEEEEEEEGTRPWGLRPLGGPLRRAQEALVWVACPVDRLGCVCVAGALARCAPVLHVGSCCVL